MLRRRTIHRAWEFALEPWRDEHARLGFSSYEWLPATVPGYVHADLRDQGVIADPLLAMHELGSQWVDEQSVSYRTEFEFEPDEALPRRVLRFEGLDTCCSIRLNGAELATHSNMFVPLELDVSDALRVGRNSLEVSFQPSARVGDELRRKYFESEGLPLDTERFPERSFVRKAQYMFGWDWGPRLVSAGIWRPVELLEFAGRISDVHVTQRHDSDGSVELNVETVASTGVFVHLFDTLPARSGDGSLGRLTEPKRWYPHGAGEPHLYNLDTYLCPPGFDSAVLAQPVDALRTYLNAVALDHRRTRIGVRSIKLLRKADEYGESFEFEVNGQSVWVMGANWIPNHSFPSSHTEAATQAPLRAARDAGMNMLRVWGGGTFESEAFYDTCDELGLLVWQDFPFACAYYPDNDEFCDAIAIEAAANVVRLRNRACLALWCGNNENLQMWQQKWGRSQSHPPRFFGERIYSDILPEVLERLDKDRPYIPTSPVGGEDCNSGGIGDQHYWDVWHGRGDWVHYLDSTARFSSEYGFASSCSLLAWSQVFSPADAGASDVGQRPVRSASTRLHEKTAKGYETFLSYVELHYPSSENLADWVYYSQLNQRDALRCAIEHYRRGVQCKGSLIWQLNDCWPVQSWAIIDSAGQRKPAWFELKRLYAPRLLSLVRDGGQAIAYAALDNASDAWRAELVIEAISLLDGNVVARVSVGFELSPQGRAELLRIPVTGLPVEYTLLVAQAGEVSCHLLLAEPKQITELPPRPIEVLVNSGQELKFRIDAPVVDLCFSDAQGTKHLDQNCLTCSRPGVYAIPYRGNGEMLAARSLFGMHRVLLSTAEPKL